MAQAAADTRPDHTSPLLTFLYVSRMHIVAIASLGTLTFGWLFTGIHAPALALVAAVDWFLVNLVNRVVDLPEDRANRIAGTELVSRRQGAIVAGSIGLLVASFVVVQVVEPSLWPLRLGYHLLGLVYNVPLLPGSRGRRVRLKELYLVKNTASALGFVITVFGYPLAALGGELAVGWPYVATMLVFFFFSELSYEVVYDLRDVDGDRLQNVRTFPVVHGRTVTRRIIYGMLGTSALALALGYASSAIDWAGFVMGVGLVVQLVAYRRFDARGVTARDCIVLTLTGAGLLAAYNAWVLTGLPLSPF
jgi:4-hydroxybenzoate polyprenyltransferase